MRSGLLLAARETDPVTTDWTDDNPPKKDRKEKTKNYIALLFFRKNK